MGFPRASEGAEMQESISAGAPGTGPARPERDAPSRRATIYRGITDGVPSPTESTNWLALKPPNVIAVFVRGSGFEMQAG